MESRSARYGRYLALAISKFTSEFPQEYKKRVLEEIKRYSNEPRKKGQERNSGCVKELENITQFDVTNPEHIARLIKEGLHLMYQKQTSKRARDSFLDNLK